MKKIIFFVITLLMSVPVSAQDIASGYFTEGYLYRHEMNPAFGNEKNYIAMPALGNMNVNIRGNMGLSDILYKRNGNTVSYLNPNVSLSEFADNISNGNNKFNEGVKLQLLGVGFKNFGGYNTIEINARERVSAIIPGSILLTSKEGLANNHYEFSDISARGNAYAELALGHSRQLNDKLRIGGKVKFLLGLAHTDIRLNNITLDLDEDKYTTCAEAIVESSFKDITYEYGHNSQTDKDYVKDIHKVKFSPNGFGIAVDLGAEYKLNDNWKVSLAITDIGFISYNNNFVLQNDASKIFDSSRYIFSIDEEDENYYDEEFDHLKDDLASIYQLEDKGNKGSKTWMLGTTINIGAEYKCLFYDKLSFGILNTTRLQGKYSWTDFRLSANVSPVKTVSVGMNVSGGLYGLGFGWIADFHTTGFNFFMGMDHILGKLAKQGVPLSSNAQLSVGINFPL